MRPPPCTPRTSGAAHALACSELSHLGPGWGSGVLRAVSWRSPCARPGVRPRGGAGTELAPPDQARGGKGAAAMASENIFLFVPNLIGECCSRAALGGTGGLGPLGRLRDPPCLSLPPHPKVMPGLSSPSFLSTSCPAAPLRPPPSICSADFWTLSMDTLLGLLIKVIATSSQPALRPTTRCSLSCLRWTSGWAGLWNQRAPSFPSLQSRTEWLGFVGEGM